MMRGLRRTDSDGRTWLRCPGCDRRLALVDRTMGLEPPFDLWWPEGWKLDDAGRMAWKRTRSPRWPGQDRTGNRGTISAFVTEATCPGCGEDVAAR